MTEPTQPIWLLLFIAALSGGLAANIIDHLVESFRSRRKEKKTARELVDAHLDPLLKAADAIVGKTISLAERDFTLLKSQENESPPEGNAHLVGLTYLYASFWSRIEILEKESVGVSISGDPRGKKLSQFLNCLGSQRIRLVDRTHQKAIGEVATDLQLNGPMRTVGLVEFGKRIKKSSSAKTWCKPLTELISRTHSKSTEDKSIRQKVLKYGVVLHSLVDTLDPEHHSTHKRPSYPNKLTAESKRRIEHLVFRQYLVGTGAVNRYTNTQ